jgi:hypothetical protein
MPYALMILYRWYAVRNAPVKEKTTGEARDRLPEGQERHVRRDGEQQGEERALLQRRRAARAERVDVLAQEAPQMSIAVQQRVLGPDFVPAHLRQPRLDLEGFNFYKSLHPVEEAVAARAGADRRRRLAVLPP